MICTLDFQWENQSEIDDIYFKYHCFYNAQTELYDRTLTDERDRYDSTSAFIGSCGGIRNLSNLNATLLYDWCKKQIEEKTKLQFDVEQWRNSVKKYYNLSAQGWIDLYNRLVEIGEYKEYEK